MAGLQSRWSLKRIFSGTSPMRSVLAWLLMAAGVALLVWDLDHVPAIALVAAVSAFVVGATLLSRAAR